MKKYEKEQKSQAEDGSAAALRAARLLAGATYLRSQHPGLWKVQHEPDYVEQHRRRCTDPDHGGCQILQAVEAMETAAADLARAQATIQEAQAWKDCEACGDDRCGLCAECRRQMWEHELEKRRAAEQALAVAQGERDEATKASLYIMLTLGPLIADAAIVGRTYGWRDVLSIVDAAAGKLKATDATAAALIAALRKREADWRTAASPRGTVTRRCCADVFELLANELRDLLPLAAASTERRE